MKELMGLELIVKTIREVLHSENWDISPLLPFLQLIARILQHIHLNVSDSEGSGLDAGQC